MSVFKIVESCPNVINKFRINQSIPAGYNTTKIDDNLRNPVFVIVLKTGTIYVTPLPVFPVQFQ